MKINKFLFTVVASASLMIGFTGCNGDDDFLEEHSYKYDDAGFYNTKEELEEGVNPLYRQVGYLYQAQCYSGHSWMIKGIGLDTFAPSSQWEFADWTQAKESSGFTRHWYDNLYVIVNYANTAIDAINNKGEKAYTDSTDRWALKAEAVFMQAWAYRVLAAMFGNCPLIEQKSSEIVTGYVPVDRQALWEHCKKQFKYASENLPTTPRLAGCVTKAAADHYLAEVCIALGDFAEAEEAATRVIDGTDGDYHLMTTRFGTRASETTDRYGNSLAAPMGAYWDLFRCGSGNSTDNGADHPDNKEAIWVGQYQYGQYSYGGGGCAWWRVRCNDVEANFLPNLVLANAATTVASLDGKTTYYLWGDDAVCLPKGVKGSNSNIGSSTSAKAAGRYRAYGKRDSLGGCYGYVGNVVIPTRWMQYTLWDNTENDFRGSETMIQRNYYLAANGTRRYDALAWAKSMQKSNDNGDQQNFNRDLTAGDTTAIFARFWKLSDDKHPDGDTKAYDLEYYYIRIAETYLLRAEARLAQGDKQGAADDINVLRNRAGAKNVTAAEVDLDLILDERARELFAEEDRWVTLNRLSCQPDPASYITDCYPKKVYDDLTELGAVSNVLYERTLKYGFSYDNRSDNVAVGRVWIESEKRWQPNIKPHQFQFAISSEVINSNSGAEYKQNPGY